MTERLLFIDYETTGLEWRTRDVVLEVAWTVTDMGLTQLCAIRQAFVAWAPPGDLGSRCALPVEKAWYHDGSTSPSEVVREMHEKSGLAREWSRAVPGLQLARTIEERILEDLAFAAEGDEPSTVYMAGAGVSHFDQDLTALHMPRLAPRDQGGGLHYRTFDVSVAGMVLSGGSVDILQALTVGHGNPFCRCLCMRGDCEAIMGGVLRLDGVIPHRAADDVATSLAYARMIRGRQAALDSPRQLG